MLVGILRKSLEKQCPSGPSFKLSCADELSKNETTAVYRLIVLYTPWSVKLSTPLIKQYAMLTTLV